MNGRARGGRGLRRRDWDRGRLGIRGGRGLGLGGGLCKGEKGLGRRGKGRIISSDFFCR